MDHHAHSEEPSASSARTDRAASHGMLVVGSNPAFFYHLPMFMSPHDYQVILEGTFSQGTRDAHGIYREDRDRNPKTHVYTFAPVPFVLTDLFPPAPKRKQIQGDLFRGHFESPPEYPAEPVRIGSGLDVNISNVMFVQKLLPVPASLTALEYLLFGKGEDLFLAHLITKKGDFDQVLSAAVRGHQFVDDELRHGVRIRFAQRANTSSQRLAEGKPEAATAHVLGKDLAIQVEPRVEFYMSQRDLA
jgi:hypothetical protein